MSKQCFLRVFKKINYCPDSGLYKHEFWDAKANTHHLELLTSEAYDKLCDEQEAAEAKLEAECENARVKHSLAQNEHLHQWTLYMEKCVETAKHMTEDKLNGWVTNGISQIPSFEFKVFRAYVGPKVKLFAPRSLDWATLSDEFIEKEVCLVASTQAIRHVPTFGGAGHFYNWKIVEAHYVNRMTSVSHFCVFDDYNLMAQAICDLKVKAVLSLQSQIMHLEDIYSDAVQKLSAKQFTPLASLL